MVARTNIGVFLMDIVEHSIFYLFESYQTWGSNERLVVVVPEKEAKSLDSILNKNKELGLEENQPLIKLIYTQTSSLDVNTALYGSKNGIQLLQEQTSSSANKLVLLGSEQKFFTTTIKEFVITKKYFSLLQAFQNRLKIDEDEFDEQGVPQHEFGAYVITKHSKIIDHFTKSFILKKRYRDPQLVKLKTIDSRAINEQTKN